MTPRDYVRAKALHDFIVADPNLLWRARTVLELFPAKELGWQLVRHCSAQLPPKTSENTSRNALRLIKATVANYPPLKHLHPGVRTLRIP